MKIIDIKEEKDGSATLDVEMTDKEMNILIEKGFNTILKEGIERTKNENNSRSTIPDSK